MTVAGAPGIVTRRLAWNVPFVAALAGVSFLPTALRPLLVAWTVFIATGLAFTDRRDSDGLSVLFSVITRSLAAAVFWWLAVAALPGPTNRVAFIVAMAMTMNVGLWIGEKKGWYASVPWNAPLTRGLVILSIAFYCQSFVGAAYRIPPLEDQDMEVQGTAYGLVQTLSPTMVTNRGTTHFFAHPPLLHFWVGASMLVTGDLERVRYYHEASVTTRNLPRESLDSAFAESYRRFEADPVLLPTRTPNVILGTLAVIALVLVLHGLTNSAWIALLGGVVYATLPEVYVRSAYGGYMGGTNLLVLIASGLFMKGINGSNGRRDGSALFVLAFLSGWMDQKLVLLPIAAVVSAVITLQGAIAGEKWRITLPAWRLSTMLVAGFLVGWGTFALYGWTISPSEFVTDHLRTHILDRLQFDANYLVTPPAGNKYPSITALWLQFAEHTGWLIVVPAVFAMVRAAGKLDRPDGYLLILVLLGGLGFSLVDWRQTKHLALILPALVLLTALSMNQLRGSLRTLLTCALAAGVAWNVWRVANLMVDFGYLVPYRMW